VDEGLVHPVAPGSSPASVAGQLVAVMSAPLPAAIADLPTWDAAAAQLAQLYLAITGRLVPAPSPVPDLFADVKL
jgi:hypothetical protein